MQSKINFGHRFISVLLASSTLLGSATTLKADTFRLVQTPSVLLAKADGNQAQKFQSLFANDWREWFWIYETVERLSRANRLDSSPWRIGFLPQPDINAYATEVNLVMVHFGLLDQIAGDDAALAFVMGHEMAHNKMRHIAKSHAVSEELKVQFAEEAQKEVEELIQKEENKRRGRFWKNFACKFAIGSNLCDSLFTNGQPDTQKIKVRRDAIIAEKEQAYLTKVYEESRKHEFEADREGYFYMTRAGYDPNGAIRVLEVLSRLQGSFSERTHPPVDQRIEAIRQLMQDHPPSTLAAEGRQNMASSPQLLSIETRTVNHALRLSNGRSVSVKTLRINSKFVR